MINNKHSVRNITQFPRNIVGYVKTYLHRRGDSKKQTIGSINGSGIMIATDVVLTNAHNLLPFSKDYDVSDQNIYFFPAYNEHAG